jgi:dsDNA-specific endonuclease/ATPase MutS2
MAKTTTRTTRPLYAALGAGSLAVDKARELPDRVVKLPGSVSARIGGLPTELVERVRKLSGGNGSIDLRALPKRAQDLPKRATELPERARKLTTETQKRARKTYATLTKEGEKVFKQLQKRRPKGRKTTRASNGRKKSIEATAAASVPSVQTTAPIVNNNVEPVVIDGQQTL